MFSWDELLYIGFGSVKTHKLSVGNFATRAKRAELYD
jgi:hypothetical protein